MQSTQLRTLRKEFWETKAPADRKHAWSTPASLIVNSNEDATTMFNTAGMQPLVPYLMGKPHPSGSKRVYNIQGCVRTVDIEEVGDMHHLTYFEMMGNWSLGDYFKKEAVERSYEFLTQWIKLDPAKLSVTVFEGDDDAPKDDETADLWRALGFPGHRITYLGKSDNRWGPAGETGPCGPDTEIFYRVGAGEPPVDSNPGNDDEHRMEIWNNVFMAYYKDADGNFSELENKNVDTGMGFERLCMVLQHKDTQGVVLKEKSVYDTDIFQSLLKPMDPKKFTLQARRIIADHARTAAMLMEEGLAPSNEGRGYVLRRIIRRMYFQWYQSDEHNTEIEHYLTRVVSVLQNFYGNGYDDVAQRILNEVDQFDATIKNGKTMLESFIQEHTQLSILPGDQAFKLYDTYGYPIDLTVEVAQAHGWSVDLEGYTHEVEQAREKARAGASKKFAKGTDRAAVVDGIPQTEFVGYDSLQAQGMQLLKDVVVDGQRVLIFDRTPMYAEGGGQKGDSGKVILDSGEEVSIVDVQKYGGVFLHMADEN